LSFQIKTFAAIAAGIINHARAVQSKVTDFTPGSVARTMLESPAVEIEELYLQYFNGLREAIPSAVYRSFSFDRMAAIAATGLVALAFESSSQARVISAGTIFQVDGAAARFQAVDDVPVPPGATTAQVRVIADTPGVVGNLLSGVAFSMTPPMDGLVSAEAAADFIGGADEETEDERRARFRAYVGALSRGPVASLEYALTTVRLYTDSGIETERVEHSMIDEVFLRDSNLPRGQVDVYIHNGVNGASTDLVALATKILTGYRDEAGVKVPGYKAAGVFLNVYAATSLNVNATAQLVIVPGADYATVANAVRAAIRGYIGGLSIGKTAFPAEMTAAAMAVEGLASIAFTVPAAPVTPALGQKAMPGTITLSQSAGVYVI
jgi:uncharacterized phage protein gp47/JayE